MEWIKCFVGWIESNVIEIIGFILALIHLFLEVKERWSMWLVGIFGSLFYVFIFFQSKIYAQMGLYAYFIIANCYGLYCWKYAKRRAETPLKISHITPKTAGVLFVIAVILSGLIGYFLSEYTDSAIPYIDAILAALSIVATWMIARKILEHWYIWIVTDFFSVGLYFSLDLYPTTLLYLMYGCMSLWGLFNWRKSMKFAFTPL
ncbi:MAG: nicotinamide riboside transporter PnuC [Bacteroidales bacterium]|jgi:nicotinamide mononucleotide transporter|nr:nicotinamide riboside transporter PnuC [Bacteroidales bacterium]